MRPERPIWPVRRALAVRGVELIGTFSNTVQLPHAHDFPETRRHPLHVNEHLGEAGERRGQAVVWVLGSASDVANCDGYVND